MSIKEIGKTIKLKKDLVLNPRYIVPSFYNRFGKRGLVAHQMSGARLTVRDLERVLEQPNSSPAIVTVPSKFFELYHVDVEPDPAIGGSPFSYAHDILVLGIDDRIWFYDPMANRPNLNRARSGPEGRMDLPVFLDLWGASKSQIA